MTSKALSFNLGIGANPSSEIADTEVSVELTKLYNAINTLAYKLDEYTGAINAPVGDRPYIGYAASNRERFVHKVYAKATVALVKGTVVYINSTGAVKASNAIAVGTMKAIGIVLEDTAINNYAPITLGGVVDGFVGLTTNTFYYVSATAGGLATTGVTATTKLFVGVSLSSTTLLLIPDSINQSTWA